MKTSRTLLRGGVAAGVAVAALGGAFVLGTSVGGDPSPLPTSNPSHGAKAIKAGQPLGSGDLALVSAGTCDNLLGWYIDNTRDMVTAWGWGGGGPIAYAEDGMLSGRATQNSMGALDAPAALAPGKSLDRSQTSSETGTNVQEAGVDEPDVVKTNGTILLRLTSDDLTTYSVKGKSPDRLSRFDLPGTIRDGEQQPEMLLVGDRVVVISQGYDADGPWTRTQTVDVSDPKSPEVVSESRYDASLLSARQYGETVRLVLSTDLPQLDFVQPQGKFTEREALKANRKVLEDSTISEWLASVQDTAGGKAGDDAQLVACGDMSRPEDFTGGGSISVVGYDPASPTERSTTGVATSSQTVYSSTDRLYLATTTNFGWGGPCCVMIDRMVPPNWGGGSNDGTTQLHAFSLDGKTAAYVGSGEVEGTVRDRWSMDAVDGTLRVAAGPSSETGNSNSIVTLKEEDGQLVPLGRVDKLGVNEQIMSVRWFDDLAILVTFRQMDPLFAIDLSDPAHPKAIGSLKIPGYSDYLHPIGKDRILGLGVNANDEGMSRGGQVSVFDLADLRHPRQLGVERYSANIEVRAGQDPRQFTWLPGKQTALTVISRYGRMGGATAWVSVLEIAKDGSIDRHNVKGTDGYNDVAALRTVPLPDGRVALVTEDSARFLTF
jgi:hypothetical protein